jgi:hypothetical protein
LKHINHLYTEIWQLSLSPLAYIWCHEFIQLSWPAVHKN